ncbi:Ubiquitin carboxyl-terminal hydrolase 30 [Chytriomyces hyalinus]|nr:Ubiquitin carboxyl-terminal hydrolase 30 [Chytriomyces hyalinus]
MGRKPATTASPMPAFDLSITGQIQVVLGVVCVCSVAWLLSGSSADRKQPRRVSDAIRRKSVDETVDKTQRFAQGDAFYPPGLHNLGNTCFMNSVIQALVSLPSLVNYLRDRTLSYYENDDEYDLEEKRPLYVTEAMLDLAVSLNEMKKHRSVIRPSNLMQALEAVKKSNRKLLCYEQQDAHELLQLVSGNLTDEERPFASDQVLSLFDMRAIFESSNASPSSNTPKAHVYASGANGPTIVQETFEESHRMLKNPLTGLMANIMTCTRCGHRSSMNCAIFSNISLAVPSVPQVTIESLLQTYITPEPIHDYICDKCTLVATAKAIQTQVFKLKEQIETLKAAAARSAAASNAAGTAVPTTPSNGKKKKDKSGISVLDPDALVRGTEKPVGLETVILKELVTQLVALEKDRMAVEAAAKYDVEAKLPDHIHKVKVVSPLTTKQIVIATPPRALCLHMQRSVFLPSGHSFKNNSRVLFGEFLDLARFCLNSQAETVPAPTAQPTAGGGVSWADLIQAAAKSPTPIAQPLEPVANGDTVEDGKTQDPPVSVLEEKPKSKNTGKGKKKKRGLVGGSDAYSSLQGPYSSVLGNMGKMESTHMASSAYSRFGMPSSPDYPYLYRLHAVVIHYGSHDSGHFVTYRRCPHPNSKEAKEMGGMKTNASSDVNEKSERASELKKRKSKSGEKQETFGGAARWFRISDERVDLVKNVQEEVFGHASQHAYMLFYERVVDIAV